MNAFEFNKIAAAVLVGLLLYKGIEILAESVFEEEDATQHAAMTEEAPAPEAMAEAPAPEAEEGPGFQALLAAASPDGGGRLFRRCQACHSVAQGEAHKTGPNLYGVLGSPVGGKSDYRYSDALAGDGGTWTVERLDAWLTSPKDTIPGNKMSFAGLRKAEERATMIAYLNSFSDSPMTFEAPAMEDAAEEMTEEMPDGTPE